MENAVEKITKKKSSWGAYYHYYRGVRIVKGSRGHYQYRIEGIVWETGIIYASNTYGEDSLKDVPAQIDENLASGKYFVDEQAGIVRMTDSYKKELAANQNREYAKDKAEIVERVAHYLAIGNYWAAHQGIDAVKRYDDAIKNLNEIIQG